ncbi:GroEL [Burkholderia pseudomallei MSHR1043]|nr:GroEL [Burkholderia pseudomallei MSHR1043]
MHRRIRREQQAGDRRGVLQRGARDLRRIEHARFDEVAVFARRCVIAVVALARRDRRDDDARLLARVRDDLAQRLLERAQHDADARLLVGVRARERRDRLLHANQRDAAARHDAFLDGRARRVQRVVDAVLLLLHLDFGRAADLDHRHAAGELRHALLQLLAIVVGRRLDDLRADLLHACIDVRLVARAVDERRVLLADLDALRAAELLQRRLLEREAGFLGDHLAAREDRDVLEQRLAAVAEARRLDRDGLQDAADVVDDERRERLALDVLGDDQQRPARLRDLLEHRQQIADVRDLLVVQQDERLVEHRELALGMVDEVRRQVAAIELQPFDDVELVGERLAVLDGDHAFLADAVDRLGDALANRFLAVRRDRRDLRDLLARRRGLADLLQLVDGGGHRLVDAALQIERIQARGDVLLPFAHDRLREHGRGRRAVARRVARLRRNLLHELRADVLHFVRQLDFLRDRHAVLRDDGRAEAALEHDVAALRPERDLHRVREQIDAFDELRARAVVENDLFRCHGTVLLA